MTVLKFRRRSRISPFVVVLLATALIGFVGTWVLLTWQSRNAVETGQIVHPTSDNPKIEVVDGDTVRSGGAVYRLVGFDTPTRGDLARCDDERRRAEVATALLRDLVSAGDARLERVPCACPAGKEGTRFCNYGRFCGLLSVRGRDVGQILIGEGLARPFICGATACPKRRPWC